MNYISQSIIGSEIFRFDEITSTNDMMRDLVEKKIVQNGAIITAKFQSKGRGQLENTWESENGKNLMLSLYIIPEHLLATEQVYVNLFACLSVFDFINNIFPERTKIKWPNDIYVDDQKIAGILIENSIQGDVIKSAIIGVGININQQNFSTKKATSLKILTANEFDLNVMLADIIKCFNFRYEELSLQLKSKAMDDYLSVLYKKGIVATYRVNGELIKGEIVGVDITGRLKLLVKGEISFFSFKEISYE